MKTMLDRYLDRVLVYANQPASKSEVIRRELSDHRLQKIDDLVSSGVPKEEAMLEALRQHGAPKVIGYKLRGPFPWIDIRSQGTARGVIAALAMTWAIAARASASPKPVPPPQP